MFTALHGKSWLYRDLKPENIMIDAAGYPRVIDFGFARKVEEGERCHTFLGTVEYMAPELIKRTGYSCGVDMWALGCLVFEMLHARSPFVADSQQAIYKNILEAVPNYDKASTGGEGAEGDCCRSFMEALLTKDHEKRLDCDAARKHPWFSGFDFDALEQRNADALPPPWIPGIDGQLDFHHFDDYGREEEAYEPFFGDSAWSEAF
jgi:serine/threonine protein kinase